MRIMFASCSSLVSLDLSHLDTSNVNNMGYLFHLCSSLKTVNLKNKFSTNSVIEMDYMFCGCSSLIFRLNWFQYCKCSKCELYVRKL